MTAQTIETPERLTLEYTLTADDLVDGSRAYYRHRPMLGWALGLLVGGISILTLFLTGELLWLAGIAFGLMTLAAGRVRWLDRMILGANPNVRMGMLCGLEFTGSGVRFAQGGMSGLIEWSSITESREGDKSIVLLQQRAPVAMIPKRAFASRGDLDAARALIAASVKHRPEPKQRFGWLPIALVAVAAFAAAVVTVFLAR